MKSEMSNKRIKLIYILAASHSGSTLLAMLLGAHPEICTAGELKLTNLGNINRYLCSCRKPINECYFWREVVEELTHTGYFFDFDNPRMDIRLGTTAYVRWLLRPLHRGPMLERLRDMGLRLSPAWHSHCQRVQSVNVALIDCICQKTGKRVIVDSSKIGLRLKYLLKTPELDIRVIRLARDGRAVALTYMDPAGFADSRDPKLRGGGMGGDRSAERLPMAKAAREWLRSNEEAEAILRQLDRSQWMTVRYEALCAYPHATLREIFAFVNVSDVDDVPSRLLTAEHHIIGNGMRLDFNGGIKLDDRWRSVLNCTELEVFESIGGRMNRQLGYL